MPRRGNAPPVIVAFIKSNVKQINDLTCVVKRQVQVKRGREEEFRRLFPNFTVSAPNPTLHTNGGLSVSNLTPEGFTATDVLVWRPELFFGGIAYGDDSGHRPLPKCPGCGSCNVRARGWEDHYRRITCLDRTYFLVYYRYECNDCKGAC